ncbi:MAG: AraC family transcriptional regulator [Bacteroidota bacterium]|nr:AraC family transcriptional regulator [Bacteroidota bacterium]
MLSIHKEEIIMHVVNIKNMVCSRCVMVVEQTLQRLSIPYDMVKIGSAILVNNPEKQQLLNLNTELEKFGFSILEDKKTALIEKIKYNLIELIINHENNIHSNYSTYLSQKLGMDYSYLSNLFSSIENVTIEKYIIQLKIDKVKELIKYKELTISEIAFRLNYSSSQALSNQFKKYTGMTPSQFIKLHAYS